ncbi:MAG: ATP-binding protein [Clostridia bacterium]
MRRSFLFTRVFSVVILTILITALFTTMIYTYISRSIFTQIKENELLPRARALGQMLVKYRGQLDSASVLGILHDSMSVNAQGEMLMGAYVVVTDTSGKAMLSSTGMPSEYLAIMTEAAKDVLAGGELRTGQIRALTRNNMVGVGVPIESTGGVAGVVLMLVPLYEAMVAMGSLNGALAMSLLLSLPVVAAMVYYVVGRLVWPLRQMRDVAVGMAGGNFEARADSSQRGEIGQLGRSLNYLSQELCKSISALTLERNRLQQTLDGLREGIVAVDQSLNITHRNPAVIELFSMMRTMSDPAQPDPRLRLIPSEQVWADFKRAIEQKEDVTHLLPMGERTIQARVTPLMGEDQVIAGAVGLFSDVTESERLERTRRDYVANVSHEMRTPLTAMRALLEPLGEGMVTDETARQRYYSIMLRETLRLSRLIDDLMELSRLQSGKLMMTMQLVSMRDIVAELSGKYSAIADDHALTFEARMSDCPMVLTNADRLEQVLVILLDNAMKYTPEGGRVTIEAKWNDAQVTMCVRDTGIGIDPKDQPYVFDRFYKVDKAHTGLGSGLGLSIASELLGLMGEKIWLESQENKGTAFYFTLRRA